MTSGRISALLLPVVFLAHSLWAQTALPNSAVRAGDGAVTFEIRGDYLPDFGIEILQGGQPVTTRKRWAFQVHAKEPIGINAPRGIFESLETVGGRLNGNPDLIIRRNGNEVVVDHLLFVPTQVDGHPRFILRDKAGNSLFELSHLHAALDIDRRLFSVNQAELNISAYLASRLGLEAITSKPAGSVHMALDVQVTDRSALAALPQACEERPVWPQDGEPADIALTDMANVVYQGTHPDGRRIKITPSATLKNVSQADIPWIQQFTTLADFNYPYAPEDQHAYLVWNLYRLANGRFEMLAASGAKHAYFTVNTSCELDCGNNHIVWPGCEDLYGANSNDTSTFQGPRNEIQASIGRWDSCDSFFDPDCDGSQEGFAGNWGNRLLVDPDELQQPGAEYFLDAWYVVQYDVDIWNTMGYLPIDPEPSGKGWLMNPGAYQQGPAISQWVAESTDVPNTDHDVITIPSETPEADYPDNMPQGHLRLLVKVTRTEPGRYRYNYALQNFDFDRGLEGFRVNVPIGSEIFETAFRDTDVDGDNNWTVQRGEDHVLFTAPSGNELGWFELFNFEVETDALPVSSEVTLSLAGDASQSIIGVKTLGPASGTGLLFEDRFSGFESP